MKKLSQSFAIVLLLALFCFAVSAIGLFIAKNAKEEKDNTTVTTSTDIVATMINAATPTDATTETTTEEVTTEDEVIIVPKATVMLDERKADGVDAKYLDFYPTNETYTITKLDTAYKVTHLDTSHLWYASPIENSYVYCDDTTAIRQTPNKNSKDFMLFNKGYRLNRVAISNNGWDIVEYGGYYYFVWCENITNTKPITETTTEEITTEAVTEVPATETPVTEAPAPDPVTEAPAPATSESTEGYWSPESFRFSGVVYMGGYAWTWYTERILPGEGLDIPGRYTDGDGFVCDGEGYIVLASCDLGRGTVIMTPVGRVGKVYDYCPTSGVIDVYTNW